MTANLAHIAARLRAAYSDGPVAPIGAEVGASDVESAYAIQQINTAHHLARGRIHAGRKIGLTSQAVQLQLGVDQPDFGVLFHDMQIADAGTVSRKRLLQPRIEGEIALSFARDMTQAPSSIEELARAVDWLAPALEIVDSRIKDWRIGIVDTVADNASSALFVIGAQRRRPAEVDTVACSMQLLANDEVVSQGSGAACLGNPYIAADWLVRKMIALGEPLRAGEVILTGALGPMVEVKPRTRYDLEIEGLGSCTVAFD